jgi:hypothetical protein
MTTKPVFSTALSRLNVSMKLVSGIPLNNYDVIDYKEKILAHVNTTVLTVSDQLDTD